MSTYPSSREEAAKAGLRFFSPRRPCARGHMAPRYVSNGACSACLAESNRAIRERLTKLRQIAALRRAA